MNKQKIVVRYALSDSAIRNYFLAGDKKERKQEIEIETNNEFIIDQAELIKNEYLEIEDLYEKKNWQLEFATNGSDYHYSKFDDESCVTSVRIDCDRNSYFDKILTGKEVIEILNYKNNSDYQKCQEEINNKWENLCKQNIARIKKEEVERTEEEKKAESERKAKEAKEKELKKSMIDDFVEKSGSETLKLRKELGYDYEGLAIQEKTDQIELQGYEKIVDSDDIDSIGNIKKPRLELMKLVKDVRQLDYVENAEAQIWTKKLDYEYADYDENPEKIEVLKVEYNVFYTDVTRYYIVG
jgi:hypothetical protein